MSTPSMGALFKRRARRANESRLSGVTYRVFVGSHCSLGGMSCVGVSFRVIIGSCYSLDWPVEPMNRVRPASSTEFLSGRIGCQRQLRVFIGWRCSHGGLVESMIFVCIESK